MSRWKLILHWTAGTYEATEYDRTFYHYLVDGYGRTVSGKYPVHANGRQLKATDRNYAAHCGGGNSYAIGVSLCGMAGFTDRLSVGSHPLTVVQCEAAWKLAAQLCAEYAIPVTPTRVMSHWEFGETHPKTSSHGKIDIIYLPHKPNITDPLAVNDYIREKIKWYLRQSSTPLSPA